MGATHPQAAFIKTPDASLQRKGAAQVKNMDHCHWQRVTQ